MTPSDPVDSAAADARADHADARADHADGGDSVPPADGLPPPPDAQPAVLPRPPGWTPDPPPVPLDTSARTSPLTVAIELVGLGGLAILVVLQLLLGAGFDVLPLLFAVAAVGYRVLAWAFRTYTVSDTEIVLQEGVLQRRHRVVPFTRIQQVELRQQLLPRILSLAEVHVETAAEAGSTAVSLRYLELPRAEALRAHLLGQQRRLRETATVPAAAPTLEPPVGPPLLSLAGAAGVRSLMAAGATSGGVSLLVALGLLPAATVAAVAASEGGLGPVAAAALFVLVVGVGTLAVGLISGLNQLFTLWDYELTLVGDDLHVSYGLFDHRRHTMPRHRLQHVRVEDNPVRRLLGFVSVRLHSAALPGGEVHGHIDLPWCHRSTLPDLLEQAMGSPIWRPPELAPRPPAARRRAIVRRVVVTAVPVVVVSALTWPAGAGVLPVALLGVPWGLAAHRRAGSHLRGPVVAAASGVVVHELSLVPLTRIQSARTSSSPLQRRAGLATIRFDVAGQGRWATPPGLGDVDAADAADARQAVLTP